jgi:hypothetical protein
VKKKKKKKSKKTKGKRIVAAAEPIACKRVTRVSIGSRMKQTRRTHCSCMASVAAAATTAQELTLNGASPKSDPISGLGG